MITKNILSWFQKQLCHFSRVLAFQPAVTFHCACLEGWSLKCYHILIVHYSLKWELIQKVYWQTSDRSIKLTFDTKGFPPYLWFFTQFKNWWHVQSRLTPLVDFLDDSSRHLSTLAYHYVLYLHWSSVLFSWTLYIKLINFRAC